MNEFSVIQVWSDSFPTINVNSFAPLVVVDREKFEPAMDLPIQPVVLDTNTTQEPYIEDGEFPELNLYTNRTISNFSTSKNKADPYVKLIKLEKASREHARILNMLVTKVESQGWTPYDNIFIDLFAEKGTEKVIYEVKSNSPYNTLSQIRKGLSQLYEYRYRTQLAGATVVLVLQEKPENYWVIDYLLNDRRILLCWLLDENSFDCPEQCKPVLMSIGII